MHDAKGLSEENLKKRAKHENKNKEVAAAAPLLPVVQLLRAECVVDVTYISCQEDDDPQHHQDRALLLETPRRRTQQRIAFHMSERNH